MGGKKRIKRKDARLETEYIEYSKETSISDGREEQFIESDSAKDC